jgi:DNA methylase
MTAPWPQENMTKLRPRGATRATLKRHRARSDQNLAALYGTPLQASRSGSLFSAFPYPTKISPETIALFIGAHTRPGDTVFDGFAGSGTTGIAALLCQEPTESMRSLAQRLGLKIEWGRRNAVLREIGVLGSFVARTLCDPPEPDEFRREAERILCEAESKLGWMYEARSPDGKIGSTRHVVWSEVLMCPNCGDLTTLWDGCVQREPAKINSDFRCPHCSRKTKLSGMQRLTETAVDELVGTTTTTRVRKPVWVYGVTDNREWSRPITASDEALLRRINEIPLPPGIPVAQVPWGDLYRSGYHQGISHLHHFYTKRNLIVFATLWKLAGVSPLRDALHFWLLSYNESHATIMTRVVAKHGQRDLVVTSSQPGVLYVSGLPVEKNLFAGLRRKLKTIYAAFTATYRFEHCVQVTEGSCLQTNLPDQCVDYVFTDPPFGGNIPYAEVNFLNEAWLGKYTDAKEEITISRTQGKDLAEYRSLVAQALSEVQRILKNDGKATMIFHSASSSVWNALSRAYTEAGFALELASVLDKTQGSFKQVTTNGAVKGDPALLLVKRPAKKASRVQSIFPIIEKLIGQARVSPDRGERTPYRLYSRFVTHCLTHEKSVPLSANEFYRLIGSKPFSNAKPSDE